MRFFAASSVTGGLCNVSDPGEIYWYSYWSSFSHWTLLSYVALPALTIFLHIYLGYPGDTVKCNSHLSPRVQKMNRGRYESKHNAKCNQWKVTLVSIYIYIAPLLLYIRGPICYDPKLGSGYNLGKDLSKDLSKDEKEGQLVKHNNTDCIYYYISIDHEEIIYYPWVEHKRNMKKTNEKNMMKPLLQHEAQ